MKDKFAEYYNTDVRIDELSEYVHQNMKIIMTKMTSEMRRKLDITPDLSNSDGYVSLMVSLLGRTLNEQIYSLCGYCQTFDLKASDIIPLMTLRMLVSLLKNKNPLQGLPRDDVKGDKIEFEKMYFECIEELRAVVEALPKDQEEK